ncbi:MAG: PAS domain S-box protein [Deltaproteobacteria bacterium]|nr:PAS domain S-box protein [Deltaproteobacteria bacterium]
MGNPPHKSKTEKIIRPFYFIQGKETGTPLNAAIVGGGEACYNLLEILDKDRLSRLNMKILGISDLNPETPGFRYAKDLGLFTTTNFEELFSLEGINLIIELTGSDKVRDRIFAAKPSNVSVLDHMASRVLWDLFQIESEKTELEKEHKQYELKTKKQTQVILDSLPYRIMVVNMDLTVETVNQTFIREFGIDRNQIEGKHCFELRHGLNKPCNEFGRSCFLRDHIQEIKEKGLFSTVNEFADENGETRYDVITISPIFDERGELVQILEASRDITERVKLEKEVEKSNTFFENMIQSTVDGIVVVDTKGNVLIFNEGMEGLTGYSSEEIINRGHLSMFYDIDVAKENMKKMRSNEFGPVGKLNPTSLLVKNKDGDEIPVTLSASVITIDGEEIGSVGVFTDMREILKMRKNLEEAHLQLVQTEKIASVGRMAAGVAHEINNPLSGVLIYAELLKEDLKDQPQCLEDIQQVIDQTLRCKKIVSEMLEFSRQSVGKTSSFNLAYLITKCLGFLVNQAIFQDIEVVKKIEPDMPEIVGDMGQLQQVFTNLFINAVHAMESKGELRIAAKYDNSISFFIIKVSDTGPGIPVELRDKIFDIFFTTKPVGTGTGLGLSISQNIIKLHGGNISFECPPEGGTTFTIELPLEFTEIPTTEEPVFIGLDES